MELEALIHRWRTPRGVDEFRAPWSLGRRRATRMFGCAGDGRARQAVASHARPRGGGWPHIRLEELRVPESPPGRSTIPSISAGLPGSRFRFRSARFPVPRWQGATNFTRPALRDISIQQERERRFYEARKTQAIGARAAASPMDFNNIITAIHLAESIWPSDRAGS